jgi:HSP20 family protein
MIVVRRTRQRPQTRRPAHIDPIYQLLVSGGATADNGRGRSWRPPVEVFETEDTLQIVAEIAGMQGDDIEIVAEGDILTIQGNRPDPTQCEHRTYHVARIGYGPFAADIQMPFTVDTEAANASYENGFLHITLPRTRVRTIIPTRVVATADGEEEQRDA